MIYRVAGLVTHTKSRILWFRQVVPKRHRAAVDDAVLAITKFMSFRLITSWGLEFYRRSDAEYVCQGMPDDEGSAGRLAKRSWS